MTNTRPLLLLVSLALLTPSAALAADASPGLPAAYAIPVLPDLPRNKPMRSLAEVQAAGRRVLEEYADPALAALGYLDVTKAPYSARGDGVTDDTMALQRALDDARDARLVVWLPAGTYLVRQQLHCVQGVIEWRRTAPQLADPSDVAPAAAPGAPERLTSTDHPCVIQGPDGPARAVIRLAPDAPGFADPASPRAVLFIYARRWTDPHDIQFNVSFNQVVSNVDFDIRGHAGAIGLDLQGAQGSGIQNVHIEAAGALAGLRGLTGSGGSTHQVTVRGGRFGVLAAGLGEVAHLAGAQPTPLLVGATLTGQTEAAIHYAGRGPLVVVGARIQGRGIVCVPTTEPFDGALTVVDSTLEVTAGDAITSSRPVYVANSYVRGTNTLVRFDDGPAQPLAPSGWTHVKEFAGAPAGPFPTWVDGRKLTEFVAELDEASAAPPADVQARHALPAVPAWNTPGVVNAKAAPYHAAGDNVTDDAPAIQRALDEHPVVFLPKGRYRLSHPLVLPPGRKLIGAGRTLTVLVAEETAPAFADGANRQPLLDTADDPRADTMVARLKLEVTRPGVYALRWRAGAGSVVFDIYTHRRGRTDPRGPNVLIEGGGRWYNFCPDEQTQGAPDYRHVLVRHTRAPLVFYMFNPEHARGDAITEFVDVRDVTFYGLKGETYEIGRPASGTRPLLLVRDTRGFRLYGAGGICGASAGHPPWIYRFENCHDIVLTTLGHQRSSRFADPAAWAVVSDVADGREIMVPGSEFPTLYRRK